MASRECNRNFCIGRSINHTLARLDSNSSSHRSARENRIINIAQSYCLTNNWRNNCFILEGSWHITSCFFLNQFFSFSFFFNSFFVFVTKHISQNKTQTSCQNNHKDILQQLTIQVKESTWNNCDTETCTCKPHNRSQPATNGTGTQSNYKRFNKAQVNPEDSWLSNTQSCRKCCWEGKSLEFFRFCLHSYSQSRTSLSCHSSSDNRIKWIFPSLRYQLRFQ